MCFPSPPPAAHFRSDGRLPGVARIEDRLRRKSEDPRADAREHGPEIPARETVVADAALEDRVPGKREASGLVVIDDGVGRMPRRVDHAEPDRRIGLEQNLVAVPHDGQIIEQNRRAAEDREIPLGVLCVVLRVLVREDRASERLPHRRDASRVIEMPVGQEDLLEDPAMFPDERDETLPLRARIDGESVSRRIVDEKERVFLKIPLHGDGHDHPAFLLSGCDEKPPARVRGRRLWVPG